MQAPKVLVREQSVRQGVGDFMVAVSDFMRHAFRSHEPFSIENFFYNQKLVVLLKEIVYGDISQMTKLFRLFFLQNMIL